MPDLRFAVEAAEASPSAATPLLALKLRVSNTPAEEAIHSVVLSCQVQIDAARRRYSAAEEALLHDLFGERARWGDTLRSFPWAQVSVVVPAFKGSTVVSVPLVCSIDVTQGPAKYLFSLAEGDVPLTLLFSGTVFYAGASGALQIGNVPWNSETTTRVPVALVQKIAAAHHSDAAFLSLGREVFDRLHAYRLENGFPSWEHAVESLLARAATKEAAA